MRMYMWFGSANPRCLTLIISPAFSGSFRERLTVISHRESSAASCLTGKYTNRIPFSSSSFFVSMASSILQYITFAVLLIGSPANAFGNGTQSGSGVAAVINSYSICLFSPFILCIILGLFPAETFRAEPVFSYRFKPMSMQAGQHNPSACILCYSYFSTVQPVLPDAVPAPVPPAAFCSLWCAHCGWDFHSLSQFMAAHRLGSISHQPGHAIGVIHR